MTTAAKVTYRWEKQASDPIWRCQSLDMQGRIIAQSQTTGWPVCVDDYDHDDGERIAELLAEHFPGAEIVLL